MNLRRTLVAMTALAIGLAVVPTGPAGPSLAAERRSPLTNLAHLDWLGDTVAPPDQHGPPYECRAVALPSSRCTTPAPTG